MIFEAAEVTAVLSDQSAKESAKQVFLLIYTCKVVFLKNTSLDPGNLTVFSRRFSGLHLYKKTSKLNLKKGQV